jgi:sterol desaturase/sphingolipid hydroxylase (fatty acid hydroxylase superfamily)
MERLFPVARWVGGAWRVLKNFGLAGFNALLSPLIVLPVTQFAAGHAFTWRPDGWTDGWFILIDLLILDCWIYWWHRINHEVQFLWRFHEVHHLDETLDASSALRFHFGEVLLSSLVRAAVIIALGIPFTSVVLFETAVAISAIFHHSNTRLPAGWSARSHGSSSRRRSTGCITMPSAATQIQTIRPFFRSGTASSAAAAPRSAQRICRSALKA